MSAVQVDGSRAGVVEATNGTRAAAGGKIGRGWRTTRAAALLWLGCIQPCLSAGQSFENPILPGYHADPSICRAGPDFYLVTSSSEWFPGLPIYHSRDLVHWEQIGNALERPSQLDLDQVACSAGVFAPTLRYHAGTFYLVCTLVGSKHRSGDFVVTATNPAGPWSEPHWIAGAPGIDPSLLFDDNGRVYLCGNARPADAIDPKERAIWIQEIDPQTWTLGGPQARLESRPYFASHVLGAVNNFEAPHLYHIGEWYYLMVAHGGTGLNHAISFWRSRSPLGPFSVMDPHNPVLTHRGEHPDGITCIGHGDLVDTPDGRWWMTVLGVRSNDGFSNMGRETFLVPVAWSGDWPVVNPDQSRGRVDRHEPRPDLPAFAAATRPVRDTFDEAVLGPWWCEIRTPRQAWWSLTSQPGHLVVQVRPESLNRIDNPSFLGQRQEQPVCTVATRVRFSPSGANEEAGLAILRAMDGSYRWVIAGDKHAPLLVAYENERRLLTAPLPGSVVDLRLRVENQQIRFDYAGPDGVWHSAGSAAAPLLARCPLGRFTGAFAGVYASSNGQPTTNQAVFDYFEYRNEPSR